MKALALINIGIAILLMGVNLPLILRKVSMNRFYGIRFAQSFKSAQNWYAINAAGGKIMIGWALLILAWGIAGFFLKERAFYSFWSNVVIIGCVLLACVQCYWMARKIDRRNSFQIEIDSPSGKP